MGETQNISLEERLRDAGLRPTRQRVALADLLFAAGDRHVSAEALHEEAQNAGFSVSLATVYNTLHQFRMPACCASSRWRVPAPISTPMCRITIISSSKKMRK